jgi:hypothetical protein
VSQGEWGQATPHIERLIKQDDDDFYEERWQDILSLFSEIVARGYAREALQLLDGSHWNSRHSLSYSRHD